MKSTTNRISRYIKDEIDSTQEFAIKILQEKASVGPVIVLADRQTKGRGKGSRIWESPRGNIYLTIAHKIPKNFEPNLEKLPNFSILAGIILAALLGKEIENSRIRMKWPNDVLIDEKKCAGILPELYSFENNYYLLLGIGINWYEAPLRTSCALADKLKISKSDFTENLIDELIFAMNEVFNFGFQKFEADIRKILPEN